jgi:hypothetical protein
MRTGAGPRLGSALVDRHLAIVDALLIHPLWAEPLLACQRSLLDGRIRRLLLSGRRSLSERGQCKTGSEYWDPEHFTEHAVSENIIAGNVMSRRAIYMYGGALLPRNATGGVNGGLGQTTSAGTIGLIEPTREITYSTWPELTACIARHPQKYRKAPHSRPRWLDVRSVASVAYRADSATWEGKRSDVQHSIPRVILETIATAAMVVLLLYILFGPPT